MSLSPESFRYIAAEVKQRIGVALADDKAYLVESRLTPVAREYGYSSLNMMAHALKKEPDERVWQSVTDAMTTNETSFFRDHKPFDYVRRHWLPEICERVDASQPLRIWCAAASSGQEPYTLSICMEEERDLLKERPVEILATDISTTILAKAQAGRYSQFEVQRGTPIQLLINYFTQDGDDWLVKDQVKQRVQFMEHNLLDGHERFGRFHAIFCRNVLIYFDDAAKQDILQRLYHQLEPGGILVLGSSETILQSKGLYEPVADYAGIFRKR